ncbi:MAG: TetR/AcrR family transcriptional regulator [Deinococcota bacterium]
MAKQSAPPFKRAAAKSPTLQSEGTRSERIQAKSTTRRQKQKAALRRAILTAAEELFVEHGYENFSLRQVAEAIGYSPTTIYLHFSDKDELLFHVAVEGFKNFGEALQAGYDSETDPVARLTAIGRAYFEFGLAHPVHYRLMFMQRGEFFLRPAPDDCEAPIDSFTILIRTLEEGIAAGKIKPGDVADYANLVWMTIHGIVSLAISMPYFADKTYAENTYTHYSEMLKRYLCI